MSALKPGFWKATVRGVADVTVMTGHLVGYYLDDDVVRASKVEDITDAKPLIVLDIDPGLWKPAALAKILRATGQELAIVAAQQIDAQTKPARIEEPRQWGVVKAGLATYLPESGITYDFVKHDRSYWISKSFPQLAVPWDDLIDPVLIRDGLEATS